MESPSGSARFHGDDAVGIEFQYGAIERRGLIRLREIVTTPFFVDMDSRIVSIRSGLRSVFAGSQPVPRDVTALVAGGTALTLGLESLIVLGHVETAIAGYVVAYVGYTLGSLRVPRCVAIFQAFTLLAVFRLLNLAFPAFVDLTLYWLPLVYLPMIPAYVFASRSRRSASTTAAPANRTASSDGRLTVRNSSSRLSRFVLARSWRLVGLLIPVILAVSLGLSVAELSVAEPPRLVPEMTLPATLLVALVVALAAVVEELLFRGLLQSALVARIGVPMGVGLAALLFASMQFPTSGAHLGVGILAGLVYGIAYEYTETLLVPGVIHVCVNVLVFVVLPERGGSALLSLPGTVL